MTINELSAENQIYRYVIERLKTEISHYDYCIRCNEDVIGNQLGDMEKAEANGDCTLCMGECSH